MRPFEITLILVTLFRDTPAFSFNLEDTPLSKNVEDRRESVETILDPTVQENLAEYLEPAKSGKLPFKCSGLRDVKDDAAKLAEGLTTAPTFLSLRKNFEAEMGEFEKNPMLSVDVCKGSKSALTELYDSMLAVVKKHRKLQLDATKKFTDTYGLNIVFELTHQSEVSEVLGAIRSKNCPGFKRRYLKLVTRYRAQGKWSLDELEKYNKRLSLGRRNIETIHCE